MTPAPPRAAKPAGPSSSSAGGGPLPQVGHLRGPRVALRAPGPEDLPLLFQWLNDPDAIAPWDRFEVDSYAALEEALKLAPGDPRSLAPRFLLTLREHGRPIGVVGFFNSYTALDTVDLWYAICLPEERGKGYGSEAVGLLTDYVFAHRPVERVGATSDVENPASFRTLQRVGFRPEGTMRRALFHHGAWHDVGIYGLTRQEWAALRRAPPPTGRPRARS